MTGNSLLLQVLTAGLAIGIVITYIQPTITTIRGHQDEISKVREEADKIASVNQKLAALYSQVNEIPQRDKAALFTYLPDKVDDVRVLKDLNNIGEDAGVEMTELSYGGKEEPVVTEEVTRIRPDSHIFTMAFLSSYEQFKQVLSSLERNNYPLLIKELDAVPTEGGLLNVKFTLITYSHKETE